MDGLDLDEATKKVLLNNITQRLMPQAVKCRADIQVSCFTHEGIDAVKEALLKGLENDKEEMPIKVSLKLGSVSCGAIGRYCGPIGPWCCPAPSNILQCWFDT